MNTQDTKLKTASEVAELLGIAKSAVYRYTRTGEFAGFAVAVGNKYRYRPDGIEDYLRRGGSRAASKGDLTGSEK